MGKGLVRALAMVLVLGLFLCSVPNEASAEEEREAAETLAISQVSLGYQNSAAVLSDGSLWMWGADQGGDLGGKTTDNQMLPEKSMDDVASVSLGYYHSAVIKTDGSLWTWGYNTHGQLGDGTYTNHSDPVKILEDVVSVDLEVYHSAAIKADGSLWTWGCGDAGQLGNGSIGHQTAPVKILDDVASVSLGGDHGAALKTDGSLWAWGYNRAGQVGDGTTENKLSPVKILDNVASVSLGRDHSAALKTDGSLWIWGSNRYGQLGDGTIDDKLSPVKILDNVAGVSLGENHSAAVKTDGSLWTWGRNTYGQLGDGTIGDKTAPVKILEDAADVILGVQHSAVIKTDGSLWMWGGNDCGQLGDGTTTNSSVPKCIAEVGFSDEDWDDGSLTSVTVYQASKKQYYGGTYYTKKTPAGIVQDEARDFINAINGYLQALETTTRDDRKNVDKDTKTSAEMLREADEATNDKMITMDASLPEEAADAVYETLAEYLDMYVDKGAELGEIDLDGTTFDISKKIVDKIRNQFQDLKFSKKVNGYTVSFHITGFFWTYAGNVKVEGNGRSYTGVIISSSKDTAKAMDMYLNEISGWAKTAAYKALDEVFKELVSVTGIADFTKDEITELLTDRVKTLQERGYGDILSLCLKLRDGYEITEKILSAYDAETLTDALETADDVYDKITGLDYSDKNVSKTLVSQALTKLQNAKNAFADALKSYLNGEEEEAEESIWDSLKTLFVQCPVDLVVYDGNGNKLGSVTDNYAEYTDAIQIQTDGDVKTIQIPDGLEARVEFTATGEGDMTCVLEQAVAGEITGRLNYYDIPLTLGGTYTQTIPGDSLTAESSLPLTSSEGTVWQNEYFSVEDESANVNVACEVTGNGSVYGMNNYAKGSPVTLFAYPLDENTKFQGWYIGDQLVEYSAVYRFPAMEDVTVAAVFAEEKVKDPSYNVEMSDAYEGIADMLIYQAAGSVRDIVISMAGLEEAIDSLNVTLKAYDSSGNLTDTAQMSGQYDGEYRFTFTEVDLTGMGRLEIYDGSGQLMGTISAEAQKEWPFADVNTDSWFYDSVKYVYEKGIMTGLGEGTIFGPGDPLARAQFAIILHRMNGEPEAPYSPRFHDVGAGIWYTNAILWAADTQVVTGYSNGNFGPGDLINREQMAVMMYRYANYKGYDTSARADFSSYQDAFMVSDFAAEAMQWAVGEKIITGKYNETQLDPKGNASRAECATIIMRFVQKYEDKI